MTQNFVGCLKNVYINEVSVLYQMSQSSPAVTYHGGATVAPHYSCREVVNIPISFPTAASMLKLDAREDMKTDFQMEFDFKTVRSDALLLYLGLKDADDVLDFNFGYIEVVLLHIHHNCHHQHHHHISHHHHHHHYHHQHHHHSNHHHHHHHQQQHFR